MGRPPTDTTAALLAELAEERRQVRRSAVYTAVTALGLGTALVASWLGAGVPVVNLALLTAFLAGGVPASLKAGAALIRERKLDIDLLMVLAAVAAALVGEARDGAILLFLFSLASTLEERAFSNTRKAVVALMDLRPETATLVEPTGTRVIEAEAVPIGAVVLVRPGERVPLDGVVLSGASSLDQSPITGESVPVDKGVGDALFAGSVNGYGALEMRVTKDAASSTLSRMIELVTEAQSTRSPSQRFSEWFGERYTVLVLVGTLMALGAFFLVGMGTQAAFYKAATLLVVASPCAIVISVPAAVLSALARAARTGVLFKGGAALEAFGAVEVVALDKTGTLTEGKMRLTEVVPFGLSETAALELAVAVESASEHPVAEAIRAAAPTERATLHAVQGTTAVPGMGIRAVIDGRSVWAGNRRLVAAEDARLDAAHEEQLARLEGAGRTVVILGEGARVLALLAVSDTIRPSAAGALASLRKQGVKRVAMLTGDHAGVAMNVAAELGIPMSDVHAGLLPEQKVELVQQLSKVGKVAFVGDGVNDAAALASASVGVAMGVAGSDAALEAADVALLADDLAGLPAVHSLARRTNRVIRQNLTFALGIMLVMVAFTLFSHLPLPLGVLGHEGGTILVVMNGLRLLGAGPTADTRAQAERATGELARPA